MYSKWQQHSWNCSACLLRQVRVIALHRLRLLAPAPAAQQWHSSRGHLLSVLAGSEARLHALALVCLLTEEAAGRAVEAVATLAVSQRRHSLVAVRGGGRRGGGRRGGRRARRRRRSRRTAGRLVRQVGRRRGGGWGGGGGVRDSSRRPLLLLLLRRMLLPLLAGAVGVHVLDHDASRAKHCVHSSKAETHTEAHQHESTDLPQHGHRGQRRTRGDGGCENNTGAAAAVTLRT